LASFEKVYTGMHGQQNIKFMHLFLQMIKVWCWILVQRYCDSKNGTHSTPALFSSIR